MKISYQWLQDFVDLDILGMDVHQWARALTMLGLAVESVEDRGEDFILDIEVTTNRPDCLNHLGVAREIAAQFKLKLKKPDCSPPAAERAAEAFPTSVAIDNPERCPRYTARVMTGVKIEESPDWLKKRLEAVGQRPINNIVDITNYVLLEVGHPLHAFDYEKLEGHRIVVRTPQPGETLVTLDGIERQLSPSMLMICDARKPVALGGVMGGQDSEISLSTGTILLESAYFSPPSIRSTAKELGMRTEASYRFERGADPEMPVQALNRACGMIQQITGGVCVGPVIDQYPLPPEPRVLKLSPKRIVRVVGRSFDPEYVVDVLSRLNFEFLSKVGTAWQIQAPSFRHDIEIEDDLVEEVARHYGYDRIGSTYPDASIAGGFLSTHGHEFTLTRALEGFGFYEAVNYVFSTPEHETPFWDRAPAMLRIANPLTEVDTHLRTSLIPGLIDSVRRNFNRGSKSVRLFELGSVFIPGASGNIEDYSELSRLGLVATGSFYPPFWGSARDEFGFYHLKGIIEELLGKFGRRTEFHPTTQVPWLHPGVGSEMVVDGESLGWAGELHPRLRERYKFLQPVFAAELAVEVLYSRPLPEPRFRALPKFPAVENDLSFVIDKQLQYARIINAVKSLNISDLRDIQLIDLYQGPNLPKEKVSLALRLTFINPERTLTQDEVNRYTDEIFATLRSDFAAERRS